MDGKVGIRTRDALYSSDAIAKKVTSTSKPSATKKPSSAKKAVRNKNLLPPLPTRRRMPAV